MRKAFCLTCHSHLNSLLLDYSHQTNTSTLCLFYPCGSSGCLDLPRYSSGAWSGLWCLFDRAWRTRSCRSAPCLLGRGRLGSRWRLLRPCITSNRTSCLKSTEGLRYISAKQDPVSLPVSHLLSKSIWCPAHRILYSVWLWKWAFTRILSSVSTPSSI